MELSRCFYSDWLAKDARRGKKSDAADNSNTTTGIRSGDHNESPTTEARQLEAGFSLSPVL